MPDPQGDVVAEIRALRDEVHALRQDLRRLVFADEDFLNAVAEGMGDTVFVAVELVARALEPDEPGARLAALIAGASVRSVGRRLARLSASGGHGGYRLERLAEDRDGIVWRVFTEKPTLTTKMPSVIKAGV